jgi:hypothetical protein
LAPNCILVLTCIVLAICINDPCIENEFVEFPKLLQRSGILLPALVSQIDSIDEKYCAGNLFMQEALQLRKPNEDKRMIALSTQSKQEEKRKEKEINPIMVAKRVMLRIPCITA